MSDDQLIASLTYHGKKIWPDADLARLIALARAGAAVKAGVGA
jgi:hypothetical protein